MYVVSNFRSTPPSLLRPSPPPPPPLPSPTVITRAVSSYSFLRPISSTPAPLPFTGHTTTTTAYIYDILVHATAVRFCPPSKTDCIASAQIRWINIILLTLVQTIHCSSKGSRRPISLIMRTHTCSNTRHRIITQSFPSRVSTKSSISHLSGVFYFFIFCTTFWQKCGTDVCRSISSTVVAFAVPRGQYHNFCWICHDASTRMASNVSCEGYLAKYL